MRSNSKYYSDLRRNSSAKNKKKPQTITFKKVNNYHNPNVRKAMITESRKEAIRKLTKQLEQQAIALRKATNTNDESRIFYRIKSTIETLEIVILF